MAFRRRRQADRIARTGPDSFALALPESERDVLRHLLPQLRALVTDPPEAMDERSRRLFPTAYPNDPELDREYQHYMREELVASRSAAIDDMLATLDATTLNEAQLMGWMRSINGIRLVLGTVLDVSEDDDPDDEEEATPERALYGYLSYLLEVCVEELQSGVAGDS
jgi:GGDEF domain-containing protein